MNAGVAEPGFERALGRRLISRREYVTAIGEALEAGDGFAAGKLGGSEQAWLAYPAVRERDDGLRLRAFEAVLAQRSIRHAGIWPSDPEFLEDFSDRFAEAVGQLDAIGLFRNAPEANLAILRRNRPSGMPIWFEDQEPARDRDAAEGDCWLDHLRGRRILLVCPFADFLRKRARADVYEPAWRSVGKRWFEPASVESVEFPYGFDPRTQRRYATALELLDEVTSRIDRVDYDCALIAAGGLGIPLAAHVKRRGRVGISLGGHLQVAFGVHGQRWMERREWREEIFNDAWVGLPERYRPDPGLSGEDYW